MSTLARAPAFLILLLLTVCSAQSSKDIADLSLEVKQEKGTLFLRIGLELQENARVYVHPRFGLEEQLGGYLEVLFIDTRKRAFELASGKPKTKYPQKKYVKEMPAGSIFELVVESKGDWPYSFTTPENNWLYELPPGEYQVLVTYEVPEDAISNRLDMDPISATATEEVVLPK